MVKHRTVFIVKRGGWAVPPPVPPPVQLVEPPLAQPSAQPVMPPYRSVNLPGFGTAVGAESAEAVEHVEFPEIHSPPGRHQPWVVSPIMGRPSPAVEPVQPLQPVNETVCCVCKLPNDLISTLCNHKLHLKCILKWCERQVRQNVATTCPVCRTEMLPRSSGISQMRGRLLDSPP